MRIRGKRAAKVKVEGGAVAGTVAQTSDHPARHLYSARLLKNSRGLGAAMAPQRPTVRLRGKDAAKAITTTAMKVEPGAVAAALAPTSTTLPADPQDRRLTLEGIVLDGQGKIDITAYEDLFPAFKNEPPRNLHPYPDMPGVKANEQIPKGLRIWDDVRQGHTHKEGAGWVAVKNKSKVEKKKEKWVNIRICGSWRMAFLFANLQLTYWEGRTGRLRRPTNGTAASAKSKVAKRFYTPRRRKEVQSQLKQPDTLRRRKEVQPQLKRPKKKKCEADLEEPGSPPARKAKAPRKLATRSGGAQEPKKDNGPRDQMEYMPIITPSTLDKLAKIDEELKATGDRYKSLHMQRLAIEADMKSAEHWLEDGEWLDSG